MSNYDVVPEHDAAGETIGLIGRSINEYNESAVGYYDETRVVVLLKDADGDVVGGLYGSTFWNWLDISLLWVREDLRGQGYGSRLLQAAEREAVERGCRQALLDTFSFQAPGFYRKHGYQVFGELDGFASEHKRFYMRKALG